MRILITIGAAALILAGQLVSAEARGGRGGGGSVHVRGHVTSRGPLVPPHLRASPDAALGNPLSHRTGAGPRYTALPGPEPVTRGIPVLPVDARAPASTASSAPASMPPVRKAVAASPWCPPERLVGSGTGFCLIN